VAIDCAGVRERSRELDRAPLRPGMVSGVGPTPAFVRPMSPCASTRVPLAVVEAQRVAVLYSLPLLATRSYHLPVSERIDLPQGTLDLLILKTLSLTAMHGWAISERIRQISKDVVMVPQGSLYPALHRLERRGWISAEWGTSDSNRKAKFYKLTAAGRKQLAEDSKSWERLTAAVGLVMDARA
jgi:PadR family transcriptional regulator PadR